ncbi:uncharacterized protein TRIADDRAFT_53229 [Trichoplax adhaerens]|uniref:Fibronectin type-III domain-containing protein n=1 Tax=Trichoplax adhaerens TaxID=10228 RepID=B3RNN4_TRIAD|nr:hypothetical protein TRIADDRAFT_53229 [Trichoplax adhaerens]EDV27486.1 hypothetical protein TRIADDRAFT_53229 [Trichoplax adhaerens]|eukprot:XP_002109320.1 hypothetical protein TRIADDRAFT_53229 [Trichoplax adhaerens]
MYNMRFNRVNLDDLQHFITQGDEEKVAAILQRLVDDVHIKKDICTSYFNNVSNKSKILLGLFKLLQSLRPRLAGNASYIIGTLAESEVYRHEIMNLLLNSSKGAIKNALKNLTSMMLADDDETIINAAGTLGTLAESSEGRNWIVNQDIISHTISSITNLLSSRNLWIANNAALVLARLTISEVGCKVIINHRDSDRILSELIEALGADKAGRGMNAAFAVGRMCDIKESRSKLLALDNSPKMLSSLAEMLACPDLGSGKNACYAVSCLAASEDGHDQTVHSKHAAFIFIQLVNLLNTNDAETGWFAAMTLRTLASRKDGLLQLRKNSTIVKSIQEVLQKKFVSSDIKAELEEALKLLERLQKPPPPVLQGNGEDAIIITWNETVQYNGLPVKYKLQQGDQSVYVGEDRTFTLSKLKPDTQYEFRLKLISEGDESPFSEIACIKTPESTPSAPVELEIQSVTSCKVELIWKEPLEKNGNIVAYEIYEASQSMPKPSLNTDGDNVTISWKFPETLEENVNQFQLLIDGKVVYTGQETQYKMTSAPIKNKEYKFRVYLWTKEGEIIQSEILVTAISLQLETTDTVDTKDYSEYLESQEVTSVDEVNSEVDTIKSSRTTTKSETKTSKVKQRKEKKTSKNKNAKSATESSVETEIKGKQEKSKSTNKKAKQPKNHCHPVKKSKSISHHSSHRKYSDSYLSKDDSLDSINRLLAKISYDDLKSKDSSQSLTNSSSNSSKETRPTVVRTSSNQQDRIKEKVKSIKQMVSANINAKSARPKSMSKSASLDSIRELHLKKHRSIKLPLENSSRYSVLQPLEKKRSGKPVEQSENNVRYSSGNGQKSIPSYHAVDNIDLENMTSSSPWPGQHYQDYEDSSDSIFTKEDDSAGYSKWSYPNHPHTPSSKDPVVLQKYNLELKLHSQSDIKAMPIKKRFIPMRMKPVFESQTNPIGSNPNHHNSNNNNNSNSSNPHQRITKAKANLPELGSASSSTSNNRSYHSGNHGNERISANYFTGVATIPPIDQKSQLSKLS